MTVNGKLKDRIKKLTPEQRKQLLDILVKQTKNVSK